jgi:ectoine hydroxylase-related dioxygenase (phytanoyl-CoA dioxygenase family)
MDFYQALQSEGYSLARGVLPPEFTGLLLRQIEGDLQREASWHAERGIPHATSGALLNALAYGGHYLDLLDCDAFLAPFDQVVGEDCIVYVMSSASVPPRSSIYTNRVHVDSHRVCSDHQIMLACMVFLSPATHTNGPWFLPASFALKEAPDPEHFFRHAVRITADPGDVLYFNPKTWHSGSNNPEAQWRHALTAGFCKPWMKQRFDLPTLWRTESRALPESGRIRQKLGFMQQVPVTYADYYNKS